MPAEILNEPLPEDYRGCFDRDYIGFWDLGGKDVTVAIRDVKVGKLAKQQEEGKKEKKILIYFDKTDKALVCNKTNAETIAGMYGPKPADWKGKRITLYAAKVKAFGQMHDCIRVRPQRPLESVKKETA